MRLLGRTSLLMYWAHLEIVYGLLFVPWARDALTVEQTVVGVVLLTAAMLALAVLRTRAPGWLASWRGARLAAG